MAEINLALSKGPSPENSIQASSRLVWSRGIFQQITHTQKKKNILSQRWLKEEFSENEQIVRYCNQLRLLWILSIFNNRSEISTLFTTRRKEHKILQLPYLRRSFSTISSMLFSWQNNRTRCCDTTGSDDRSLEPGEEELTPIPQSTSSCLRVNNNMVLQYFFAWVPTELNRRRQKNYLLECIIDARQFHCMLEMGDFF